MSLIILRTGHGTISLTGWGLFFFGFAFGSGLTITRK